MVAKAIVIGQFTRRLKPMAMNEKQEILLKFTAVPFKERKTKQTGEGFSLNRRHAFERDFPVRLVANPYYYYYLIKGYI